MNSITITKDVLTGKDARTFISKVDVDIDGLMANRIYSSNDDDYLLITKKIGSKIRVDDVKLLDDAYFDSLLLKK